MPALFFALIGSKWVRRLGICFAVVAGYAWWEAKTEQKGAERVVVKIEKKANADVQTADSVRDAVAAGKRGLRNPYRRAD